MGDHDDYMKQYLAQQGVYYFGDMGKQAGLPPEVEERPALHGSSLPPLVPTPEPPPAPPVALPPQVTEKTPLVQVPVDIVSPVQAKMRQFTVTMPDENGQPKMLLRCTMHPNGDLDISGHLRSYAATALGGRELTGQGLEAGTAAFTKLSQTPWGTNAQVRGVNLD